MLKNKLLIFLFLFFLLISPAWAQGCFLYPESEFYCRELTSEMAVEECSLYPPCNLKRFFSPHRDCSQIPECQQIFCKSTCTYEYKEDCLSGAIPSGEEKEWCSSGGCLFFYAQRKYCEHKDKKWLCEIEAENKDTDKFSFQPGMGAVQCQSFCQPGASWDNLVWEPISEKKSNSILSLPELEEPLKNDSILILEKSSPSSSSFWKLVFLFFLLGAFFYYLYKTKKIDLRKLFQRKTLPSELSKEKKSPLLRLLSPFTNPALQRKLRKLREERKVRQKKSKGMSC